MFGVCVGGGGCVCVCVCVCVVCLHVSVEPCSMPTCKFNGT